MKSKSFASILLKRAAKIYLKISQNFILENMKNSVLTETYLMTLFYTSQHTFFLDDIKQHEYNDAMYDSYEQQHRLHPCDVL